jgi:hypothetical protein
MRLKLKEEEIVEVLRQLRSVYDYVHNEIHSPLSEDQIILLGKFKLLWENGLLTRQDLIDLSGISIYELAFLSGYIYYAHRVIAS